MTWEPRVGDYVWFERGGYYPGRTPAQIVADALDADHERIWIVRCLTGQQGPRAEHRAVLDQISSMPDMELIALASCERWNLKL